MSMYSLVLTAYVAKLFPKIKARDRGQWLAIDAKILQILENPHRFKPLRAPMQHRHRVHIGSFVLVYVIDEKEKAVVIVDYAHHDDAYN